MSCVSAARPGREHPCTDPGPGRAVSPSPHSAAPCGEPMVCVRPGRSEQASSCVRVHRKCVLPRASYYHCRDCRTVQGNFSRSRLNWLKKKATPHRNDPKPTSANQPGRVSVRGSRPFPETDSGTPRLPSAARPRLARRTEGRCSSQLVPSRRQNPEITQCSLQFSRASLQFLLVAFCFPLPPLRNKSLPPPPPRAALPA